MGPTNQETLDWLKNLSGRKYSESNVEAAKVFFGKYDGTRKMFSLWTEKFLTEHKKVKQEAHTRLMKACGGSGKKFDIPPSDFVPLSLSIENKCVKCNDVFENTNSVKSHIKDKHKEDVKKAYSKEAMEMVMEDKIYIDWLNKTTSVDSENDRIKISQLQKANRILTEKLNMQSEKEYTMVKENNGVTEMQKKIYTTTDQGVVKSSVITHQFVDITSRKRSHKQSMNTSLP